MVNQKAMGIGSMFIFLILAVVLLPMIVRWIGMNEQPFFSISGFADIPSANPQLYKVPKIAASAELPSWVPDPNTNYLCRSPNESGKPCEEGWFCDGTTQRCVKQFPESNIDLNHGYYS
jgi:hypothetical protein